MQTLKPLMLGAALVLALSQSALAADLPPRILTVTGEGHANATPDMVIVRFAVVAEDKTAEAAMAQASKGAGAALASLNAAGLSAADVQSSRVSLYPLRRDRSSAREDRPDGFSATLGITARLRQIDKLGAVLDQLVGAGVNQFDSITFALQQPQPSLDEARGDAIADAARKAALYAAAAGVTLGPVVQITEGGANSGPQPMMMQADMARGAVPIAVGEAEIAAQVTVIFALQ